MDDLSVLDTKAELFLLTLLELGDVRALQLQSDFERVDRKPVCKVLFPSALTSSGVLKDWSYANCVNVHLVSCSCPVLGQRGKHGCVDQ
jgi:hypothetical protein